MRYLFSNYASGALALSIDSVQTTLTLSTGQGEQFPLPGEDQQFQLVIEDVNGEWEVCTCTNRVGDQLQVIRGVESSVAKSFGAGSRVELRLTAAVLSALVQAGYVQITSDLDMNSNSILNALIEGPVVSSGVLMGTTLRSSENNPATEVRVSNTVGLTAGGNKVWHAGNGGAGSGLDADRLQNLTPAQLRDRATHTGMQSAGTITGLAPSATVDTRNASNINSGTLATARLAGGVLRHSVLGSGVVRVVSAAPGAGEGSDGDIWLVAP